MHSADRIWIVLLSMNVLSKPGGCVHFPPLSQNPQENQYIRESLGLAQGFRDSN